MPPVLPKALPSRIFVVENHADTLFYLVLYLQNMGFATAQARSMTEALALWPDAKCSILISDIGLPDGDGWELLRRLRLQEDRPSLTIAMSGFGRDGDEQRSRDAGYAHHLLKPFDPEKLDDILGGVVLDS